MFFRQRRSLHLAKIKANGFQALFLANRADGPKRSGSDRSVGYFDRHDALMKSPDPRKWRDERAKTDVTNVSHQKAKPGAPGRFEREAAYPPWNDSPTDRSATNSYCALAGRSKCQDRRVRSVHCYSASCVSTIELRNITLHETKNV